MTLPAKKLSPQRNILVQNRTPELKKAETC